MTRARAVVAAVPQRVWTAVAGLVLLASLAIAAVLGAGLQVWRGAVGTVGEPPKPSLAPPDSGIVVVPGGSAAPHRGPTAPAPAEPPVHTVAPPPLVAGLITPVTPAAVVVPPPTIPAATPVTGPVAARRSVPHSLRVRLVRDTDADQPSANVAEPRDLPPGLTMLLSEGAVASAREVVGLPAMAALPARPGQIPESARARGEAPKHLAPAVFATGTGNADAHGPSAAARAWSRGAHRAGDGRHRGVPGPGHAHGRHRSAG